VFRRLRRFVTDRNYRETRWFYRARPKELLQPSNVTGFNRYPEIFSFVQRELGQHNAATILSFGCSTGEEVFSLRQYFSQAALKGIDINPGNIAICNRRLNSVPDNRIKFELAGTMAAEARESYDAIFCMAVLRHGELARTRAGRCDHLLPFAKFADVIDSFRSCLKPGGLLALCHSNFRLCDAPAGSGFEAIFSIEYNEPSERTPLFGSDNQILPDETYPDAVFRKTIPPKVDVDESSRHVS
jgi:SAM-dependent methyltransferase